MRAGGDLLGRDVEAQRLALVLHNTRNGRGSAILVVGEPGIGKTALLQHTAANTTGMSVLWVSGFESESTIPFGGVHRLLLPLRTHLGGLPDRQRQALDVAVGGAAGPPPDRFLVGLGMLSLLAAASAERPVVCAVDDAHLLDQESLDVLAFVARRLVVESIALLFAARSEGDTADRLAGVPVIPLAGLTTEPGVALLSRSAPGPIDPATAASIVRATGGNPLALIDLADDLSARELDNLDLRGEPIPVGRHLEAHYLRRLDQVDPVVRDWLLLASADAGGNVALVTLAASRLGLSEQVIAQAEAADLVEVAAAVAFRHPLVRSAVYNAATGSDRRRIHRALAVAADELGMVEIEAWHASRATIGTDPDVADRLEHAADLAARRGGLASRARILSRAAELTPSGPVRDARLVGAAEAALTVGAAQVSQHLVDGLDEEALDPVCRGRIIVVRNTLALFTADPAMVHGPVRLIEAADAFHPDEPDRELESLLKAFEMCVSSDRLIEVADRARLAARLEAGAAAMDGPGSTILHGLSALMQRPYEEAVGPARAAFEAIVALPDHELMRRGSSLASLAAFLWDGAGRTAALLRATSAARDVGALQLVDELLWIMSISELSGGTVRRATTCTELVREVRRAMGYDAEHVINAAVMAWTGTPKNVVLAIAEGAKAVGFGGVHSFAVAAVASAELADGAYRDACRRLAPLIDDPFLQVTPLHFPDYVEAAARSGRPDEAELYARRLARLADANGSGWCRGLAERALALTDSADAAETHFTAAIRHLEATSAEVDLARAHLLYGEWLRRMKRRREASRQLARALELFERSGADLFLARARAELDATGTRLPPNRAESSDAGLTVQEGTIARLAASGRTNVEIAGNLFISPNTVDYHLRKVFQKLGVSSRRQLADRLAATDPA